MTIEQALLEQVRELSGEDVQFGGNLQSWRTQLHQLPWCTEP